MAKKKAVKKQAKPKAEAKTNGQEKHDPVKDNPFVKHLQKKAKKEPKPKKVKPQIDLEPLKKKVEEAKSELTKAENESKALEMQAKAILDVAKKGYAQALTPYREACRKSGVKCEYTGGKSGPVAPRVRFLVERVEKGIKVSMKDKPETEEIISDADLKKSVGKAALAYCEKHIGPVETQGAKHAGLGNRLRTALRSK